MTLFELQKGLEKKIAKPDAGTFMLLRKHVPCEWVDVYLGAFTVMNSGLEGVCYVDDFYNEDVVQLTGDIRV